MDLAKEIHWRVKISVAYEKFSRAYKTYKQTGKLNTETAAAVRRKSAISVPTWETRADKSKQGQETVPLPCFNNKLKAA